MQLRYLNKQWEQQPACFLCQRTLHDVSASVNTGCGGYLLCWWLADGLGGGRVLLMVVLSLRVLSSWGLMKGKAWGMLRPKGLRG